jgi:RNA polymerase sigma-70 factor (ECF subfamily)
MDDVSADTSQLNHWLERMRAGDQAARDELIHACCGQLERLARKMLRRYPAVRRWTQTDDVLQSALLRLLRALQEVKPASMRHFFALASEQMRRELIDLSRHLYSSRGPAGPQSGNPPGPVGEAPEPPAREEGPEELDQWGAFHREVERLPVEEREVVGLIFYHGWSQAQVAELFGVTVRTVQRRWNSALVKLHRWLKEGEPA